MNEDKNRPLVIVSHELPDTWLSKLIGKCKLIIGPDSNKHSALAPELLAYLPQVEGLLTLLTVPVNDHLLQQMPQLKVVSNMAVGVDNVDIAACNKRGIPVGHTPDVLTDGTADLTMALLLSAARQLSQASSDAREGRWTTWSPTSWLGADLQGATLGIVGLGKIGTAVAERAVAFGLRIVYHSSSRKFDVENRLGARAVTLEELLQRSDFVCLHPPLTQETYHLIDADALQMMKPTAVLVNVSRGPVIDSSALEIALREKWIAGAALDVTEPEPLPPDSPLYQMSNCLIVPHIGSATINTRRRMAERACDNLLAGLAGVMLPYCVNPEVYDD